MFYIALFIANLAVWMWLLWPVWWAGIIAGIVSFTITIIATAIIMRLTKRLATGSN